MVGSVNGHARTEQVRKQIKQKVGKQAVSADRALHDEVDVLIVGAGISGIGMAVHLQKQCPGKSFALVDRRANLGGTWDLFRYPGIRSDSDMHTLGFVFEPWREQKAIADGPSILKYLNKVVDDHALRDHIAYSRTVVAADWDTLSARWSVTLKDESKEGKGHISTIKARFLYMGSGYYDYDQGHKVDFAGSEDFKGDIIHPQFWPKDYDYSDKKIVVIGSGATAVTLVPALTDKAAHVTMLQRTPTWYFIRPAKDALANFLRRILPDKWAYAITRFKNIHMQSFTFKRARAKPDKAKQVLSKKIKDDLGSKYDAAAFTPPYAPWEQRLCLVPDSDFFKAIVADKAEVVTDHVDHIDAARHTIEIRQTSRCRYHRHSDRTQTSHGGQSCFFGGWERYSLARTILLQGLHVLQHSEYGGCFWLSERKLDAESRYRVGLYLPPAQSYGAHRRGYCQSASHPRERRGRRII